MASLFGFDLGDWSGIGDIVSPIIGAGVGAYKQSQADNAQSEYLNYLRQREDKNYQDYIDQVNQYNQQGAQMGSGGGGGAAAAAATEANRQRAARRAMKSQQGTYRQLLEMYAPYRQTADRLLPQMTGAYENSLGLQNSLLNFVKSPEQMAKLNGSVPAWQTNVPLPDSVRIK